MFPWEWGGVLNRTDPSASLEPTARIKPKVPTHDKLLPVSGSSQGSRPCVRFAVLELVATVATFLLFSRNSTPPRRETTGKLFQCALWTGRAGMGPRHDV